MRRVAGQNLLSRGSQLRHHRRQRRACRPGSGLAVLPDGARTPARGSSGAMGCACRAVADFVRGHIRDDAHYRRHHHGLRHPAPVRAAALGLCQGRAARAAHLRIRSRLSRAQGRDGPVSVVLGAAAAPRPLPLRAMAGQTLQRRCASRRTCARPSPPDLPRIVPDARRLSEATAHRDDAARGPGDAKPMTAITIELNGSEDHG